MTVTETKIVPGWGVHSTQRHRPIARPAKTAIQVAAAVGAPPVGDQEARSSVQQPPQDGGLGEAEIPIQQGGYLLLREGS